MIKTVVFDIGHVLIGFDWKAYLDKMFAGRLSADEIKLVAKATFGSTYWTALDRDEIEPSEAFSAMKAKMPGYESYITETMDNLDLCAKRMDYAIPWITELKKRGFRVLYLSNCSRFLTEKISHSTDFISFMDGGVASFEEKCAKPDKKIYRILFKRFDLIPSECVFVDDTKINIEVAHKLGMNAVLFSDYEQARSEVNSVIHSQHLFYDSGDISHMLTVKELCDYAAAKYSDNTAFIQFEGKNNAREITFKELAHRVECLQAGMIAKGISGSHIAAIGETSIDWITLYLATVSGCGIFVPIDKELDSATIVKRINAADVDYIFCSDNYRAEISHVLPECKSVKGVFGLSYDDMPKGTARPDSVQTDPDETCLILYTSGTTGANKGVMLTNRNIMSMLDGTFRLIRYPESSLSVLPIHHAYELHSHILPCLYYGTMVYINDDVKYLIRNLVRSRAEMSCMVPMMLEFMVRRMKKALQSGGTDTKEELRHDIFGDLKMIVCGGAPLKQETADFIDGLGIKIHNGYGMTECSPVLALNPPGGIKPNSVGCVLPTVHMRVADVNADGYGELQVSGDSVMKGYYKDPDATAEVFTADGWFKTGDIGYIDEDEYVYIKGRKKNLIILSNGENIVPEEMEQLLHSAIPYAKECIVYASDDAPGLTAEVYLDPEFCKKNGLKTATLKKQFVQNDLNTFNAGVSGYKRIYDIVVRDSEFNKNAVQKIQRFKNGEK